MTEAQIELKEKSYGCEEFGRLRRVILHKPGKSLSLINESNYKDWLFDSVPDIERFNAEHHRYKELLTSLGVEVLELADYVTENCSLMHQLPNLTYLHDIAVISSKGAILSSMAMKGRKGEEIVVREALSNLGIPIFSEFKDPGDCFEGCLLLSPETVLVANTERHNFSAINKFIRKALIIFDEVIYVDIPKSRRYMHPDTIYNRVDEDLAIAFLSAFKSTHLYTKQNIKEIDFGSYMRKKGIEIINVSDVEQKSLACSFVPLEPGVIIHYDTALNKETRSLLEKKGVEMILFHPEAMIAGGGSLRCLTLRVLREP